MDTAEEYSTPDKRVLLNGALNQSDSAMVESPKMTNIHAFIDNDDVKKAQQIMQQTFHDGQYTEYANWLGLQENRCVLKEFLNLVRPWPLSLYLSLCKLSRCLYLIAEAGPLDSILEELSIQWMEEHGEDAPYFKGNYKVCHIILFSLLILNSDLHNESFDYKFTADQFVENTIYAVNYEMKEGDAKADEQLMKRDLAAYFVDVTNAPLPLCPRRNTSVLSNGKSNGNGNGAATASRVVSGERDTTSTAGHSNNLSPPRDNVSLAPTSHGRSSLSVSRKTSIFSLRPGSSILERTMTGQSTMSSASEFSQHVDPTQFYVQEPQDDYFGQQNDSLWLVDHELNFKATKANQFTPPTHEKHPNNGSSHIIMRFFKKNHSSSLSHQHQRIQNANKKMQRTRAVVRMGSLELHLPKQKNKFRNHTYPSSVMKGRSADETVQKLNLFGAFAEPIGETVIELGGTSKPKCFQITLSEDQHYKNLVFECATPLQCEVYIDSINFWASRITPTPNSQFEMVSNQEYGWSEKLLNEFKANPKAFEPTKKGIRVFKWEPLYGVDSLYTNFNAQESGKLQMDSQLLDWQIFVSKLRDWIDEHNNLKPTLVDMWSHSPYFELVMDNWNVRYLFLNKQYHKHNEYLTVLKKAYELTNETDNETHEICT